MTSAFRFEVVAGSICGYEHPVNQDAFIHATYKDYTLAVICDGCGEKKNSHIGSRLGSEIMLHSLVEAINSNLPDTKHEIILRYAETLMLQKLENISLSLCGELRKKQVLIEEFFLFTILGVIADKNQTSVFALGDGCYSFNNEKLSDLGGYDNNAPPYFAYGLYDQPPDVFVKSGGLKIVDAVDTNNVDSIIIGSDGALEIDKQKHDLINNSGETVGKIHQFLDAKYFNNPIEVTRKLTRMNTTSAKLSAQEENGNIVVSMKESKGLLFDDTTIIAIRTKKLPKQILQKQPTQLPNKKGSALVEFVGGLLGFTQEDVPVVVAPAKVQIISAQSGSGRQTLPKDDKSDFVD